MLARSVIEWLQIPFNVRVLIVDDEVYARKRLVRLLKTAPEVELLGECSSGQQAVHAIETQKPDLVLLDIQMPEMSGFDVIESVGVERMPLVIFVTAHDEYALRAFAASALDYLCKPFDQKRLREALQRARIFLLGRDATQTGQRLAQLLEQYGKNRPCARLCIRTPGRIFFVATRDIDWVEALGNYVQLHAGPEKHLMRSPLQALEGRLDPQQFVRIHRSTMVNIDRIKEIQPHFGGDQTVILKTGARLVASRQGMQRLFRALPGAGLAAE